MEHLEIKLIRNGVELHNAITQYGFIEGDCDFYVNTPKGTRYIHDPGNIVLPVLVVFVDESDDDGKLLSIAVISKGDAIRLLTTGSRDE